MEIDDAIGPPTSPNVRDDTFPLKTIDHGRKKKKEPVERWKPAPDNYGGTQEVLAHGDHLEEKGRKNVPHPPGPIVVRGKKKRKIRGKQRTEVV